MLVSVIAALPVSAESNPTNYHQSLKVHALEGTPVVDGVIDDIWEGAEVDTLEYLIAGDGQLKNPTAEQVAEECGIQYRVMWDKDRIYFLVEIHDDEFSPDFFKPDDVTSQSAQWWKTDALFMYVSETGLHTGYTAGNSYQLVLPLTEDYYESAIIRKGEKETGHPVKDGALTRKTVLNGNDMVIELSLELREENVAENHIGQTMAVAFQYHDVDASSEYASQSNPRTLCVCSSNKSPDIEGSGRNNWVGIKLTRDYEVLKGTPTLDGVIDDLWTNAEAAELSSIVTLNGATSESLNADKVDSSSAYAKVIYDGDKVYMLLVAEDDDYYHGNATDWKNDSFMIKLAEQRDWFSGDNKGNNGDAALNYASLNTYQICAQVDSERGAYVRDGKGNALNIGYASTISGDADNGYTFVIEISIELNVLENEAGNVFYTEFQYNDANPENDAANNNRDLVRCWNSGDLGMGQANGLAIMRMSENSAEEEEVGIEPSLVGDYYVADWDGNVQYTLNFDNGTLIIVDKVEEDGVDVNGTYTYAGTFETGITVYDASGEATTITISQMRGVPTFNATNMGFGSMMTAGQPPVTPELVLGNNAIATKVENYYAAPVKATFTAAKAGKYILTAAAGEENAFVAIEVENGSETAELPYEFELEAGETVTFYISTSANVMQNNGNFEDEINLVLSLEGENAETGDLGVMIAVVALVAVLGMGITAVTSKRVSVR